jgi:Rod binding domain-containing protein
VTALPPIDQAALPAEIRNGSAKDKQNYQAALGFERMLLGELTKAMADTAQPVDGGDSSDSTDSADGADTSQPQDAASSMYMQMLPDQLADAVTKSGGLGLAQSFYDSIKERS